MQVTTRTCLNARRQEQNANLVRRRDSASCAMRYSRLAGANIDQLIKRNADFRGFRRTPTTCNIRTC